MSSSNQNPFGVKLKSPKRDSKPRIIGLGKNSAAVLDLSSRRQSLRHVKTPPPKVKRVDSTGKKYLRRVAGDPFTIRHTPVFGVVLRSTANKPATATTTSDQQEEANKTASATQGEYLDLDFREDKNKFDKNDSIESDATPDGEEKVVAPFGVRLKPAARYTKQQPPNPSRTYQIDLNPVKGQPGGTYQKAPKSFLEIKLRPVKQDPKSIADGNSQPQFVELKLRHVVAAEDGGPQRTITEACFQIPINLKHVPLDLLRRPGDGHVVKRDPLEELLQMTIASLSHVLRENKDVPPAEHHITFNLSHIDRKTKEITPLSHSFDIKLRNTPRSDNSKEREVPSMDIKLRKVNRESGTGTSNEERPEFADIQLKHVKVTEEVWLAEEDEYEEIVEEEELLEGDEEQVLDDEYEEHVIEDEFEEHEINELVETSPHELRSSLPDLHLGELVLTATSEDSDLGGIVPTNDASNTDQKDNDETGKTKKEKADKDGNDDGNKKAEGGKAADNREARSTVRQPPRRMRSSSLSEIDRLIRRRDHYITLKEKEPKEQPKRELTNKQGRDLLMWYNRMKTPNKEDI